jgi:hypothetical protein
MDPNGIINRNPPHAQKSTCALVSFHVKQFGTLDDLSKRTFRRRGAIRSRDLAQAEECGRAYFLILIFWFVPAWRCQASSASLR